MANELTTILNFFQNKVDCKPGDCEYNVAFCRCLVETASAAEASIWRLDEGGWLHMVYGTDLGQEELSDIILREGEGISGAAAMSRQTIAVTDARAHPQHDHRMDRLLGYPTHAMVCAPIIFMDFVYGVVNILNSDSGTPFSILNGKSICRSRPPSMPLHWPLNIGWSTINDRKKKKGTGEKERFRILPEAKQSSWVSARPFRKHCIYA